MTHGGFYGGIGAPGEKQIGRRDIKTEALLVLIQAALRAAVDAGTLLAGALLAFALGGLGIWIAATFAAFMYVRYATERLGRQAQNIRLKALIYSAEAWFPWFVLLAGLPLLRLVLPYQWWFDFTTRRHYLIILRTATWEWVDPATGVAALYSGADNLVWRFPLLARLLLAALPVAYFLTAPLLRQRYENELYAYLPAQAVDYAKVGRNPRTWGDAEPTAAPADTVRIEVVEKTPHGNKIVGYEDMHHREEVRRVFGALHAGTLARISWRGIRDLGISQGVAKEIVAALDSLGFIEYPNGKNAPAELTARGEALLEEVINGQF